MSEYDSDLGYHCGHCGLMTPGEPFMQIAIEGEQLDMCCVGCACAAMLINQADDTNEHVTGCPPLAT